MSNSNVSSGAPWMLIIFVVLAVLKTTGVIGWSWWWVTAPLWGGIALAGGMLLISVVIAGLAAGVACLFGKKRARHYW